MGLFSFIAGIGLLQAICLITGLALLVFEIFCPGFGVPGIAGIILLVVGVVLTAKSLFEAIIMIIILLALIGIALVLVLHSASKGRLSKTMILSEALDSESGYKSSDDFTEYLGNEGISLTPLRPAGTAIFEGVKLDVVTEGEFIAENKRVKVIKVTGRRIVVREINKM